MASLDRPSEASSPAPEGCRPQRLCGIEPRAGPIIASLEEAFCALIRSPGSHQIGSEQRPAAKRIAGQGRAQLCNSLGSRR